MQPSTMNVTPMEKIVSVLSYYTMGIAGMIWIILAYFLHKKLRLFIMYNIVQSIIISVFLAILNIIIKILLQVMAIIPFLQYAAARINLALINKIISFSFFKINFSFNIIQTIVSLVILYIVIGVFYGKIFYVPYLSKIMKKVMKSYY